MILELFAAVVLSALAFVPVWLCDPHHIANRPQNHTHDE